jgi:hypothetical protein
MEGGELAIFNQASLLLPELTRLAQDGREYPFVHPPLTIEGEYTD